MKSVSKDRAFQKIALYIIPLCYLFLTTFQRIFSETQSVSGGRAGLLLLWLVLGYSVGKKAKLTQPVVSALIFCVYTFIVYISSSHYTGSSSFISILSCIFVWPIAFYNAVNIRLNEKSLQIAVILISITCNIMAYFWNSGIQYISAINSVAAINSVYYVLIAFMYVFLIKNPIIMLALMVYPLMTLLESGKTTCVILSLLLVFYYGYKRIRIASLLQKVGISIILLVSLIWAADSLDFYDIIESATGDFDSGGSGRLDIWGGALSIISNFSLETIFGYGYGATVSFLGIGAHNDFIEIFIDFGIIGLLLYLVFVYNMFKSIFLFDSESNYRITYILSLIVFFALSFVSKLVGTQVQFLLFTTYWGLLLTHSKPSTK